MKSSPHRPLILKRRKLSLSHTDSSVSQGRDEPSKGSPEQELAKTDVHDTNRQEHVIQRVFPGIKIIDHPTMSNTQVVAVPANADIQSILEALMTRGKKSGDNGPNKFILISGESRNPQMDLRAVQTEDQHVIASNVAQRVDKCSGESSATIEESVSCASESLSVGGQEQDGNGSGETSCSLDNSLTNIQWLGKMSSSGLSPCGVKKETEKENQTPKHKTIKIEEDSTASSSASSWLESFTERPPYSYMAMIQFAINSTEKKRMMLKDIYTWIEDHFPYFKHVAKPGWKNSIRHNLSLHDMFVRETSANGKISFWTIHPEANRYLTLDRVFKQQKRHTVDLQKNLGGSSSQKTELQTTRRKMKPLLPRVNSYLVPIQFPVRQSPIFHPSSKMPVPHGTSEKLKNSKQVRIAPKVPSSTEEPALFSANSIKEEICSSEDLSPFASTKEDSCQISRAFPTALTIKEENDTFYSTEWVSPTALSVKEEPTKLDKELNVCLPAPPVEQKRRFTAFTLPPQHTLDTMPIKRQERHKTGKSRRKQHLSLPCSEEPVMVLPSSGSSESFTHDLPFGQETLAVVNSSQLSCFQEEDGPFKTPMKEMFNKLPASSTPSKTSVAAPPCLALTDTWRLAPFVKETSDLDFTPVRTLPVPLLSLQEDVDLLGFCSTPPRQSLCDSPHLPLLNAEANAMVSGPLTSSPAPSKQSSPELQVSVLSENHSLMEGLVLDTMNDSLSKILLDVSFPGLDDNLGTDLSWSHLISELK